MLVAWLFVRSRRALEDSLRKAAEQADADAGELTYMLIERAHDDLTDCPGESRGGGLDGACCDAVVLRSR
jgi:hypothetical protein